MKLDKSKKYPGNPKWCFRKKRESYQYLFFVPINITYHPAVNSKNTIYRLLYLFFEGMTMKNNKNIDYSRNF